MVYCLKAVKLTNEIDLKAITGEKFFDKLKKVYSLDGQNALLIILDLPTMELINYLNIF